MKNNSIKAFIPVNILTIQNVNIYSLDVNVIPEFLLVGLIDMFFFLTFYGGFSSNRKT